MIKKRCQNCDDEFSSKHNAHRKFCCVKCFHDWYSTHKVKTLRCAKCNSEHSCSVYSSTSLCEKCKRKQPLVHRGRRQFPPKCIKYDKCIRCKCDVNTDGKSNCKFCDTCRKERRREIGLHNAAAMPRRSSNEILLAELCKQQFRSVTTNDPVFDNWDADILIWDHNVAVLWNGPWHHKQLRKNHSIKQVSAREKVKLHAIENAGWRWLILNDYRGKKNDVKFVKQQFEILQVFITALTNNHISP